MSRGFLKLLLVVGVSIAGAAGAVDTTDVTLLEETAGYSLYQVSGSAYDTRVRQETGANPAGSGNRRVYAFKTLAGVYASTLPQEIKGDIAREYQAQLAAGVSPSAINMEQEFVDVTEANRHADWLRSNNNGTTSQQKFLDCGGRWDRKSRSRSFEFNPAAKSQPVNINGFSGTLTTDPKLTGFISMKLRYSERENPCTGSVPYRVRFDGVDAKGEVTFSGSRVEVSGNLLNWQKELFRTQLFKMESGIHFWVGVVYVLIDFELKADLGLEVAANVNTTIGGRIAATGELRFDMTRDGKSSDWIENTPTYYNITTENHLIKPIVRVDAQVEAMPFIELSPGVEVALYLGEWDLVKAYLDFRLGAPMSLWYKYDNACDTTYEQIHGLTASVEAQLDLQLRYWYVFGRWHTKELDLPSISGWRPRTHGLLTRGKALGKLLEFQELGVTKSMHSPHIYADSATHRTAGGIVIGKRACAPWQGQTKYLVNWGDNTSSTHTVGTDGAFIGHAWPANGTYNVSVTAQSDEYGRQFDPVLSRSTRAITVSSSGTAYSPAGVPSSITTTSDYEGYVYASWGTGGGAGVVTNYELYEATKPDFSDQALAYVGTATSKTLTRADGTYYYRVRACQGPVCSGYRTRSGGLLVKTTPSEPAYLWPDVQYSTGIYRLEWQPAIGSVTHYEVWRSDDESFASPVKVWSGLALELDFDIRRDATWFYRVRACNGTLCGPYTYERSQVYVTYIEEGHEIE